MRPRKRLGYWQRIAISYLDDEPTSRYLMHVRLRDHGCPYTSRLLDGLLDSIVFHGVAMRCDDGYVRGDERWMAAMVRYDLFNKIAKPFKLS